MVPHYSYLQELSNGMFYEGISSTMTHIGPQRVTPLGGLLFKISLVYFTLWTSKFESTSDQLIKRRVVPIKGFSFEEKTISNVYYVNDKLARTSVM